ncbi:hypothetical protein Droror1_Dr00005400 [Drosera rotundifolia]
MNPDTKLCKEAKWRHSVIVGPASGNTAVEANQWRGKKNATMTIPVERNFPNTLPLFSFHFLPGIRMTPLMDSSLSPSQFLLPIHSKTSTEYWWLGGVWLSSIGGVVSWGLGVRSGSNGRLVSILEPGSWCSNLSVCVAVCGVEFMFFVSECRVAEVEESHFEARVIEGVRFVIRARGFE